MIRALLITTLFCHMVVSLAHPAWAGCCNGCPKADCDEAARIIHSKHAEGREEIKTLLEKYLNSFIPNDDVVSVKEFLFHEFFPKAVLPALKQLAQQSISGEEQKSNVQDLTIDAKIDRDTHDNLVEAEQEARQEYAPELNSLAIATCARNLPVTWQYGQNKASELLGAAINNEVNFGNHPNYSNAIATQYTQKYCDPKTMGSACQNTDGKRMQAISLDRLLNPNTTIDPTNAQDAQDVLVMLRPLIMETKPPISPAERETDAGRKEHVKRDMAFRRRVEAVRAGILPSLACHIAGPPNLGATSARPYLEAMLIEARMTQADIDAMMPPAGVEPSTCQTLSIIELWNSHPEIRARLQGLNETQIARLTITLQGLITFVEDMVAQSDANQPFLSALALATTIERDAAHVAAQAMRQVQIQESTRLAAAQEGQKTP